MGQELLGKLTVRGGPHKKLPQEKGNAHESTAELEGAGNRHKAKSRTGQGAKREGPVDKKYSTGLMKIGEGTRTRGGGDVLRTERKKKKIRSAKLRPHGFGDGKGGPVSFVRVRPKGKEPKGHNRGP